MVIQRCVKHEPLDCMKAIWCWILMFHTYKFRASKDSERHLLVTGYTSVGASLWAAKRIKQNDSEYAFPRYTNGIKCNSNSLLPHSTNDRPGGRLEQCHSWL